MGHLSSLIDELSNKRGALQQKIKSAEETNRRKQELMEKYYEQNKKYNILNERYTNLKTLNTLVMKILSKRRDDILKSIEERTETILAVILPEENFKVRITYEPKGKNYVSEVFVGKDDGHGNITWSRPRGTNGEFMKQLISFSMLVSINSLLGSKFLFLDEPFSSSDVINVGKMRPIVELMLSQGIQLLFIEHKKELYESLPHNIIKLMKHRTPSDEHEGFVEILQNEQVEGSFNDREDEGAAILSVQGT